MEKAKIDALNAWSDFEEKHPLTLPRQARIWARIHLVERWGKWGRGQRWEHWKAYRALALRRRESKQARWHLDQMRDPFWISNEVMGMSLRGISPVKIACDALLRAGCPADYAPSPELPSAREVLLEWSRWFDEEYLPDMDHATGELATPASNLAQATVAAIARSELSIHTPKARASAKSFRL